MTKYDIRIKRKALSKGQIARHKDFRSLHQYQQKQSKFGSWARIVLIAVALALIVGMAVLGVLRVKEKKADPVKNYDMELFEEFKN
jgi:hypothetical protein